MSTSTAIGSVSQSLQNLLTNEMTVADVDITLQAPDENDGSRRINLFLYKVQESQCLKNLDWQVNSGDPSRLLPPPLSLSLHYLMTPYAPVSPELGNITAHQILGDAMRVFYEHPVIPDLYLADELDDAKEEFRIILNSLSLDVISEVWQTFSVPYRLSVPYEISVVQIDPVTDQAMPTRVRRVGTPLVKGSLLPPVVERIEPHPAYPDTVVAYGENLSGWKAYVYLLGERIVTARDLEADWFDIALPSGLGAGFYNITIDISHLFKRTFLYEVTS